MNGQPLPLTHQLRTGAGKYEATLRQRAAQEAASGRFAIVLVDAPLLSETSVLTFCAAVTVRTAVPL